MTDFPPEGESDMPPDLVSVIVKFLQVKVERVEGEGEQGYRVYSLPGTDQQPDQRLWPLPAEGGRDISEEGTIDFEVFWSQELLENWAITPLGEAWQYERLVDEARTRREKRGQRARRLDAPMPRYEPPDFATFFELRPLKTRTIPPYGAKVGLAELQRLVAQGEIEGLDIIRVPAPPPQLNAPPMRAHQGAINLDTARHANLYGAGQRLIDLEGNWGVSTPATYTGVGTYENVQFNHPNLPQSQQVSLYKSFDGALNSVDAAHGTEVMGIIAAQGKAEAGEEVTWGIAPKAEIVLLPYPKLHPGIDVEEWGRGWHGALTYLLDLEATADFQGEYWQEGDVLLIEAQTGVGLLLGPIEYHLYVNHILRLAVELGLVVVECGGNGDKEQDRGINLDDVTLFGSFYTLNRCRNNFLDSGAILVSAIDPNASPPARLPWAPSGSRVDCHAWGAGIRTTTLGNSPTYTDEFGGTSGAGAIIAGVVLLLQEFSQHHLGGRLDAWELRYLLGGRLDDAEHCANSGSIILQDVARLLSALRDST